MKHPSLSRRQLLQTTGTALSAGLTASAFAGDSAPVPDAVHNLNPLSPRSPHFEPRIRSVIWLFMYGGPSQVDLFDPKPELNRFVDKTIPVFRKEDAFFENTKPTAMPSPYRFAKYGESGIDISEKFPSLAGHADKLCVIRSMHCESNNHGPALFQMNTGFVGAGYPSVGSWVTYALGSDSANLPASVVLMDYNGAPVNGALNWTNGFMPATYQGVPFRSSGEPILNLDLPAGVTATQQRSRLDLLRRFNHEYLAENPGESSLAARIASYELSWRMQTHAPDAVDLSQESKSTQQRYGLDQKPTQHFGRNCLLARRLVERGVRFVQVYSGGNEGPSAWDAHKDLKQNHDRQCAETDQPIAALLEDLDQHGLLDSTLIVWAGEFGRMPTHQGSNGRDHNPFGFTTWLAGGGVRTGQVYGATDDFGYRAVENRVHVHDLHATILHLLGLDHTQLTYRHLGRDFRLTDVAGRVVSELIS